jgi:hypothetical protein
MGQIHTSECYADGDQMVVIGATVYQGEPTVSRAIMELKQDSFTWKGHTISGTGDPWVSFTGTWKRR